MIAPVHAKKITPGEANDLLHGWDISPTIITAKAIKTAGGDQAYSLQQAQAQFGGDIVQRIRAAGLKALIIEQGTKLIDQGTKLGKNTANEDLLAVNSNELKQYAKGTIELD